MDGLDAENIKALLSALAPGLIILAIRQQFIAGAEPSFQDRALAYAGVSALYYAVTNPLVPFATAEGRLEPWFVSSIQYVVLPVIVGLVSGFTVKKHVIYHLLKRIGLDPNHQIPAAWDHAFTSLEGEVYLIVKLSDGSEVAGYYAGRSFASSSKDERDLLIEQVWIIQPDGTWIQPTSARSILLCGKDIRSVEFVRV